MEEVKDLIKTSIEGAKEALTTARNGRYTRPAQIFLPWDSLSMMSVR